MGLIARLLTALAVLGLAGACAPRPAPPPPTPEPGTFLGASGDTLSAEDVAARVAEADVVLLGEGHTSRCDHAAQVAVIRAMARAGLEPSIGLEMVPLDRADTLSRFNRAELTVDELPEALDWQDAWGYDFELYEPVFQSAAELDLTVHPLNVSRRVAGAVGDGTEADLPDEQRAMLPENIIPPTGEQREALREPFLQHGKEEGDEEGFQRFIRVQSLWDTVMAASALDVLREQGPPVVVLVGAGHVESGWGIEHRLGELAPDVRVASLLPWRGDGPLEGADLYVFCPASHRSSLGMTLKEEGGAVLVEEVRQGTRAEEAGLRRGDRVARAGGEPVEGLSSLHKAGFEAMQSGEPLRMTIERAGERLEISIPLKHEMGPGGGEGEPEADSGDG
ncbi:ChaN family lipoprotein [Desulfohalovibrio reitneri]|uniref:ChaN family lipoprotein n=1 Tax=Desulfohalovibrio reitneri TaxID=1307759 RepID=UPI00068E0EB6|nr:ChaN family lipoprotein [Desulfohalovibrio reitneri]